MPTPDDTTYNGWRNYETWLVNLWLSNDESTHTEVARLAGRAPNAHLAADRIKDYVEELVEELGAREFILDLVNAALAEVDWLELAESWRDDKPSNDEDEDE